MPRIYIPTKKVYKREKQDSKRDNLNNQAVYNTTNWKNLRLQKLNENPLCEECFSKGVVRSATEVHHLVPISRGKTKAAKQRLGFNYYNLKSLCSQCHKDAHK